MKSIIVYGLTALLALAAGSAAYAAENDEAHVFIGANYGGFKARGGTFVDKQELVEVTIGGFFNQYLGVEAGAIQFDQHRETENSVETDGYELAVIGRLPLSDTWGIYAKAGQYFWDAQIKPPIRAGQRDDLEPPIRAGWKKEGNTPYYGAGMDIRLASRLNLVLEYSRYKIETPKEAIAGVSDTDLDTVKIGLHARF